MYSSFLTDFYSLPFVQFSSRLAFLSFLCPVLPSSSQAKIHLQNSPSQHQTGQQPPPLPEGKSKNRLLFFKSQQGKHFISKKTLNHVTIVKNWHLSIALPVALALAADPIASLVDTAFVGHLDTWSVELAAVGVSVSIFNLVSRLFNVPLLNITTSFVAEEQALISKSKDALAAGLGIAEAVVLSVGSGFLMNIMGIPMDSSMRGPAEQFLTWRAFGAPPVVIALAAQGTFRGFKDTKTPLYAIGAGTLLNAILDVILIFPFGFGVGGAAVATVISEYLIAIILLWELNGKVELISPKIDWSKVSLYLKSGTIATLGTLTLATSLAARQGPIPMAGHQICVQIWLAVSLLTDALALSGQALLATNYSQANYQQARKVIYSVLKVYKS
ncbi:hypothetical protein V6Z11_A12G239800 [Gossypium hirsutum]